jgi:hypothetical protein
MEPDKVSQVSQTEIADAPPKADSQPRTETTVQDTSPKGVMDYLDIPPEVQKVLAANLEAEQPKVSEPPAEEPTDEREPSPAPSTAETEEEGEEEPDESEKPAAEAHPPEKIDKRQKRINRLTRQKSELQTKLDEGAQREQALAQKLAQYEGKQQAAATAAPVGPGRLSWITNERQLNDEVEKAEAIVDWCDANNEGVTIGEGDKEEYKSPDDIADWRRKAEKVVLSAPKRREEIRAFTGIRSHYEGLARQNWPTMFDQGSKENQMAVQILQAFPWIQQLPQAAYAVGLLIEGANVVDARTSGKNGARAHRDIDERAFSPRVPIAPHTPENPPGTRSIPSSKQKVNKAMSDLVQDQDGSAENLARAFAAMDESEIRRPKSTTPVRS